MRGGHRLLVSVRGVCDLKLTRGPMAPGENLFALLLPALPNTAFSLGLQAGSTFTR